MKTQDIRSMGLAYLQVQEASKKEKAEKGETAAHEKSEVEEALQGNQHKIDVNKNGKVDAHDFKLLRKKKVAEEVEQLDELSDDKLRDYHAKAGTDRKKAKDTVQKTMDMKKPSASTIDKATDAYKRFQKRGKGMTTAANKMSEEVEQIDEISRDKVRSYIRKASADNAERKNDVMKPFQLKDIDKNIALHKKFKKRQAGIETAGKKAYSIGGEPKVRATESTEWPIFNRIQEKLTLPSYKVSGVGDDPHEVTVKYAKDPHTKGATPHEKIDSKASQGEKDFVNLHGGLDGNDSGINGHKAAAQNAVAHTVGVKVAPGRPGDSKIGDKTIVKPKS